MTQAAVDLKFSSPWDWSSVVFIDHPDPAVGEPWP
jgi:hypothetical protein